MTYISPEFKKNIKGRTVKEVAKDQNDFPCLVFTDGSVLVVQCDPEGNGPGFMSLEKDGKDLGCAGGS